MSQLREHIERHPSETTRLLGLDYDQFIGLITHAENLYNQQKKVQDNSKIRIIKGGGCRPPKLAGGTHLIEHCSPVVSIF